MVDLGTLEQEDWTPARVAAAFSTPSGQEGSGRAVLVDMDFA
jgi:hypothetical protein